jgi:predicted anti-sigma-YlaC factor YlaD
MSLLSGDLTCKELVELVTGYLEGSMEPVERERFEHHLVSCRGCEAHIDQMRQTIRLTGALREDDLPAYAQRSLLEAFRQWRVKPV